MPITILNSTGYWDSCPALSLDEHLLYFTSTRPGGYGLQDLYVSRRQDRRDDLGWEPPVNLGGVINTPSPEVTPTFFEDESGKVWLYFARGAVNISTHLYQSEMGEDGTFRSLRLPNSTALTSKWDPPYGAMGWKSSLCPSVP